MAATEANTNHPSSLDQMTAIGAKIIAVPTTVLRYYLAGTIAFGLVATLSTHSPPFGLAAAAFCVWLLVRNLPRGASKLMRRIGNA